MVENGTDEEATPAEDWEEEEDSDTGSTGSASSAHSTGEDIVFFSRQIL